MKILRLTFTLTLTLLALLAKAQDSDKYKEFDFWVGEWDVNLRVKQLDNTWKDTHQSIAKIYSVLGGRAILELWEEQGTPQGIIGYSLRYYDEALDKWVLWLNWPGPNRSGTISLTGEFRHGRGEFFGSRPINDSTTMISRFTFSDITASSLRWDDAFSRDEGKTWTNNWIMEFSRTEDQPVALNPGFENHTNKTQSRCTNKEFDLIKEMAGLGSLSSNNRTLDNYGVLEGCAVFSSVMQQDQSVEFSVFTFNTFANVYEQLVFNVANGKAAIYYGKESNGTVQLQTSSEGFKQIRTLAIKDKSVTLKTFDNDQPEKVTSIFSN